MVADYVPITLRVMNANLVLGSGHHAERDGYFELLPLRVPDSYRELGSMGI